jgi:hypothetical protein
MNTVYASTPQRHDGSMAAKRSAVGGQEQGRGLAVQPIGLADFQTFSR